MLNRDVKSLNPKSYSLYVGKLVSETRLIWCLGFCPLLTVLRRRVNSGYAMIKIIFLSFLIPSLLFPKRYRYMLKII